VKRFRLDDELVQDLRGAIQGAGAVKLAARAEGHAETPQDPGAGDEVGKAERWCRLAAVGRGRPSRDLRDRGGGR
jgi:hypothetical protein